MNLIRIYGLFLRHFYLISRSFPRILDLIYWPSIQITLWGFISNFFAAHSTYYSGAVGVILSCAILYDFLFRTSIGFNMLFLEEIWSRNFTNLFIAPMKISEIIISLVFTALIRALIGLIFILLPITPVTVILFSLFMGSLWLATVPLTSGLIAHIYGLRYMGTLYGLVFFSHQIGSFLGVWMGGRLYDATGDYTLVWWIGVGVSVFSTLIHIPIKEQRLETA